MDNYTAAQRKWCDTYRSLTGFDPIMDAFEAGEESFEDSAHWNIKWFQDHSTDALLAITGPALGAAIDEAEGVE